MRRTRSQETAWKTLGGTEPYFAVLTNDRFRDAHLQGQSRQEFFASGEDDIERLFRRIATEYPLFKARRILDFGCGVGRLTLPLARRAEEVVGADVSEGMLSEAQRNITDERLNNVRLVASDKPEYNRIGTFDLIHSSIVFQHIPVRVGMLLVHDLLGRLNPGGIGALHFVFLVRKPIAWRLAHFARKTIPGVNSAANAVRGRPPGRPLMQMNPYPLGRLYSMIYDCGARRISATLVDHAGFLGAMLIFQKGS